MTELETLRKILVEDPYSLEFAGEESEGFTMVQEEMLHQSRWFVLYEYIIKAPSGKYYRAKRNIAATENQENEDVDPDSVYEVEPYEVKVVKYRKV